MTHILIISTNKQYHAIVIIDISTGSHCHDSRTYFPLLLTAAVPSESTVNTHGHLDFNVPCAS
jgi:hypothetical protein